MHNDREVYVWKLFESIRLIRDYILIRKSKFFDKEWYLRRYPDVRESRVNPYFHFLKRGGFEGRNPSRFFNTIEYSNNSGYSKNWQMNPLVHYLIIGNKQGMTRGVSQDVSTRAVEEPQEMSPEDQSITDIQTRISMDKLLTDEE